MDIQTLQYSSSLLMTYFLLRDYRILPKKETTFQPLGNSLYTKPQSPHYVGSWALVVEVCAVSLLGSTEVLVNGLLN